MVANQTRSRLAAAKPVVTNQFYAALAKQGNVQWKFPQRSKDTYDK